MRALPVPRFERRHKDWTEVATVDVDGRSVLASFTIEGAPPPVAGAPRRSRTIRCADAVEAHATAFGRIRRLTYHGYLPADEPAPVVAGSVLLVEQLFEEESPRFGVEAQRLPSNAAAARFVERWFRDGRPFARAALLELVERCDRMGQRLLVKRLLGLAERAKDDELMGCFAAAFDRMSKRWLVTCVRWDSTSRQLVPARRLVLAPELTRSAGDKNRPVFTQLTRMHLARRALRYFRRIGFSDPARYAKSVAACLARYRDEDLDEPRKLLDSWSLCHFLHHGSDVIERAPRGIEVRAGRSLADLHYAPLHSAAWRDAFDPLVELAATAQSRPAARFALEMLRQHHASRLPSLAWSDAKRLLYAPSDEVRAFMAAQLGELEAIASVPIREWLALLDSGSIDVLDAVSKLATTLVSSSRLALDEAVALACSAVAPVAQVGLDWTKQKLPLIKTDAERRILLRLSNARADGVRVEAAELLRNVLRSTPSAPPEEARELLDAPAADVRAQGLALLDDEPRFGQSAKVWSALAESPHPDARAKLLSKLADREGAPVAVASDALRALWATTLLQVSRGARDKRLALRTIADRLTRRPEEAESLAPLLAITLRSVRAAERRSGLAAAARAARTDARVRAALERHVRELTVVLEPEDELGETPHA